MKVLIPLLGLTPHGGNRVLAQIAGEFVRQGHRCRIVAPQGGTFPFRLDPRVELVELQPRWRFKPVRWLWLLLYVSMLAQADECVIANHFLTALPGRWLESVRHRRMVYLVQDIEYRFFPPAIRWLAAPLCRWTWHAHRVVPANEYLASELRRRGVHAEPALNIGVDPVFLQNPVARDGARHDVVCILRGEHHKRADRLLAIADLCMASGVSVLCICQDEALAAAHRHRFAAMVRPASDLELCAAYDDARIFLLTSEHEGFSLPPLEAMARGLPTVMFPCGGPSLYASDSVNAVMVTDGRLESARDAIVDLLRDAERYARLSDAAAATAHRFDMSQAAADFVRRCTDVRKSR